MTFLAEAQQARPQQRPLPQVERRQHFTIDARHQGFAIGAVQHLDRQFEGRCRMHHLQRLAIALGESGAQALVTFDQRDEAAAQRLRVKLAVQGQGGWNVIGAVVRLQLPEEPLALLGMGQAQRRLAIGGDEGRRRRATALPGAGGEGRQVRGFEQAAQFHLKAQDLARAGDHLGCQQRMAAQLEEVIAQPYPLDLEHFTPDRRQLLFESAARRHIGLLQQRRIGSRQGLAVELAVGGQRQRRQQHEMSRHHVVGQMPFQVIAQFQAQRGLARGIAQ